MHQKHKVTTLVLLENEVIFPQLEVRYIFEETETMETRGEEAPDDIFDLSVHGLIFCFCCRY